MRTLFEVQSSDIKDLNALQLTKLLKLLLYMEARTFGIAQRAVDPALNITVPDGGEDGRIQWKDGPLHTDYLPYRFVFFQVKATDMGPADCANELVNTDGSLKDMVEKAMNNRVRSCFLTFLFPVEQSCSRWSNGVQYARRSPAESSHVEDRPGRLRGSVPAWSDLREREN